MGEDVEDAWPSQLPIFFSATGESGAERLWKRMTCLARLSGEKSSVGESCFVGELPGEKSSLR